MDRRQGWYFTMGKGACLASFHPVNVRYSLEGYATLPERARRLCPIRGPQFFALQFSSTPILHHPFLPFPNTPSLQFPSTPSPFLLPLLSPVSCLLSPFLITSLVLFTRLNRCFTD